MKLQRILVAVKPWERGLPLAANHARQLAQRTGGQLQLLTSVFHSVGAAGRDRGEAGALAAQERTLAAARVELERLAGSLRDWGAQVTTKVVWGAPAYEAILTVALEWRADLVVVGTHDREPLHTRLTDTDWQLLRHARCPLLLVKSPVFGGYRTIVAAVDPLHGHDEPYGLDHAVLDAARSVARACGSTLRAVYAYRGPAAFELKSAVEVAPGVLYGAENVEALHARAVNELAEQFGIAATEVDLVEGPVAELVVDNVARHRAELVVVGTQQRRGAMAALFGNTAESVLAAVSCDVLIVPAPQSGVAAKLLKGRVRTATRSRRSPS